MKRISENPPPRFPENKTISAALNPWFVVKLKPRQEKAFADDLIRWDIEYYLPMVTKVTRRKDNNKPRKSVITLFPGYIAIACSNPNNTPIFSTHRVVNVISIKYQKRFIRELEQIYFTIQHGVSLEPISKFDFEAGMFVRVQSGVLRGLEGQIVKVQSQSRLILSVEGLGRASTLVDPSTVVTIPHLTSQKADHD